MNFTRIQNRIDNPEKIDFGLIDRELHEGKHVIVQFVDTSYTDKKLSQLNDLCDKYGENFGIRFYGHYSSSFDFNTLRKIPNVKCLYVDCLMSADNVLTLQELPKLKALSLGVFELKETEILKSENLHQLSSLILAETRTKAVNLDYLRDFQDLQSLIIGGHTKNIESVGELSKLGFLSFNSIKKTPVPFVNKLTKLKTLKFILGGRESIHEIEDNEIENLEIVWVRGFNDISNISRFRKLKTLLIEDNIQLPKIHFDKELPNLCDLKILNCKTLNSLTGLEYLPSLKQLRIYKTNLDFDTVVNQNLSDELKTFAFYTTKKKIDEEIKSKLKLRGYSEWSL
jgi:protein phosphatase 1 regulatory subunit 7